MIWQTRTEVYKWVSEYEEIFYSPRTPLEPISVYFSDITRNYFSEEFINSFRGIVSLLMHSHLPFQIVTSRTIEKLSPKILILPDVKCISDRELSSLKTLEENGTKLISTGEFASYDENLNKQNSSLPSDLIILNDCPGKTYTENLKVELNEYFNSDDFITEEMNETKNIFLSKLFEITSYSSKFKIDAPIELIATTSVDEDYIYLFLTNIKGICEACDTDNRNITDVKISYASSIGGDEVYTLPFLGTKEKVKTLKTENEISITIPEIERGMVVIIKRI